MSQLRNAWNIIWCINAWTHTHTHEYVHMYRQTGKHMHTHSRNIYNIVLLKLLFLSTYPDSNQQSIGTPSIPTWYEHVECLTYLHSLCMYESHVAPPMYINNWFSILGNFIANSYAKQPLQLCGFLPQPIPIIFLCNIILYSTLHVWVERVLFVRWDMHECVDMKLNTGNCFLIAMQWLVDGCNLTAGNLSCAGFPYLEVCHLLLLGRILRLCVLTG